MLTKQIINRVKNKSPLVFKLGRVPYGHMQWIEFLLSLYYYYYIYIGLAGPDGIACFRSIFL